MEELFKLIERIGTDEPPTADELTKAREELVKLLKVATSPDSRDIEAAKDIRGAIDSVDGEVKAREDAAKAEEEEAKKLLEGLEPSEEETEETTEEEVEEEATPEAAKVPVAASNGRLFRSLNRTSARFTTEEPADNRPYRVLPLGAAQSENIPTDFSMTDVANVFDRAAGRVRGGRQSLLRVEMEYPETRRLFGSERQDNDKILDALLAPAAIAAAGGVCDPLPADFTHPVLGSRGRPIRQALPRFQASRGGVRYSPLITLGDLANAVGVWTHETDVSPGEAEKVMLTLECEEEETAVVDAVTASLAIGNFQARFNPEFWRSRLNALMIAHDRLAEATLYATMVSDATAVTYGAGNGTIYSVLSGISKAVAAMRSRHRLGNTTIRSVAPSWLLQALRSDIASQRLGSSPQDALSVADSVLNNFFSVRGINPVWSEDLDVFGAQSAGALLGWPGSNVQILLYPEGTYFFMDGGTLDLGTEITDATMVRKNNRMAFMETFEKAVFRGGQALALTVPVAEECVCPDIATVEVEAG